MSPKGKKKVSLTTKIIMASVLGLIIGAIVGPWMEKIQFIGTIWIRLIQMSIVALVMTSVASAIGNIESASAGKMSFHTFKYIILFTLCSAFLGLGLSYLFKPGVGITLDAAVEATTNQLSDVSVIDTLVNFVPTNIFSAMSSGSTIQCIIFSLIFGIAAGGYARATGRNNVLLLIKDINGIIMRIIEMVMKLAPIGIFCLLAPVVGTTGFDVIFPMLKFLLALLVGDIIQFLIYCPLTAFRCGVNPLKMPKKYAKMSIMALTTTSSAVCLPTKMEDSVTKFGVSRRVADFTGPITMTMNSCGAVQCYVLAIMFMAQASGIALTNVEILTGVLLACMMCMGTIVVPGGSVVVYTFFATALGLPLESVAILIGIDWFAGALRTLMNVDVDVLVGMLVSKDLGEFDADVYNDKKEVKYVQYVEA
ncbi:dicarboxylate/amino acid:cation symporter [Tepidimicrobium xylanilyticum]|uniref:Na+/H+-dicarboxylate symporter n=1 Tax=Tepidimicrobium xylanilyticum TaxID=1123352 RepID=A0A1H3A328_9FIRM|nr:dicarboxylate/amino acid:cation symporter [Tepidimicrobium xylanilyticum]GMG96331.1 dicarboxylate/amino acid:cation symporter [Tepidimicrobium xylanilyticum]SDX24013.1 Na+/H+-dicarboxylate symporter [Tepidimicrobium xylanilyticum]